MNHPYEGKFNHYINEVSEPINKLGDRSVIFRGVSDIGEQGYFIGEWSYEELRGERLTTEIFYYNLEDAKQDFSYVVENEKKRWSNIFKNKTQEK